VSEFESGKATVHVGPVMWTLRPLEPGIQATEGPGSGSCTQDSKGGTGGPVD